jgi:hypothetical protein
MKNVPEVLDKISDIVLAYRPKAKQKKAHKRKGTRKFKRPENSERGNAA